MTDHLAECWCRGCTHPHVCGTCRNCICDELRACEQRVLDAALEAVDKLRQSNYTGWEPWMLAGVCVDKALAAINALKEDNDQRSKEEGSVI